jgi:hypothetical protein
MKSAHMKVVRLRYEAHHRGYRIEGEVSGQGFLLHVIPTLPGLLCLPWSRFRTLRAPWAKAVCDVAHYIDEAYAQSEIAHTEISSSAGSHADAQ